LSADHVLRRLDAKLAPQVANVAFIDCEPDRVVGRCHAFEAAKPKYVLSFRDRGGHFLRLSAHECFRASGFDEIAEAQGENLALAPL
jgi:hypothetical protein